MNNKPHWDVYHPDGTHDTVYPQKSPEDENQPLVNKIVLICKKISFYSSHDEAAFFQWLQKNDCIDAIEGIGNELHLSIAADELHDHDLRELLAVFYRYKIDMAQLKRFLTPENKKWLYDNKKAYWYKRVFGH